MLWEDHIANTHGCKTTKCLESIYCSLLHEHDIEPWYCKTHESNTNKRQQRRLREKKRPKQAVGLSRHVLMLKKRVRTRRRTPKQDGKDIGGQVVCAPPHGGELSAGKTIAFANSPN